MANRFQLWGQAGWASAEVIGETHYAKAIRALFGSDFDPRGTDIDVPVQLIPDRTNRHDRNAVGVWSGTSLLGHLPRGEAARYVQVLTSLHSRGLVPEVTARVHGREWGEYDGRPSTFDGSIRLDLAEPHMLVPANSPPAQEHRLLPSGSAVQVNDQQRFLEALRPLLRPEGECWAYVTLHEMADHLVEVRIGDARVGDLSPRTSGELLPALRHLAERGLATAARATVKGDDSKAEVMVYVARGQDLPESLQAPAARQGGVVPISPAPSGFASTSGGLESPSGGFTSPSGGFTATSGGFAATSGGFAAVSGGFPSGPASAQAGSTTGRGSASVPVSGAPSQAGFIPGPSDAPATAPGWAAPGEPAAAPGWAAAGEPVPSWAAPAEPMPSWATAPAEPIPAWGSASADPVPSWAASDSPGMPSWAVPSGGVPSWASSPSSGLPALPSTGTLPGGSIPRLDQAGGATGSVTVTEHVTTIPGPGSPLSTPGAAARAPLAPEPARPVSLEQVRPIGTEQARPVSPAPSHAASLLDGPGSSIAETTVIPALAAVVKGNAARRSGTAPVSPAPEANPHPPIPPAPTGIKFSVPPGWPVPPGGWYPPDGWRPDPNWPPAPSGWQWWVPTWD
ncbi:hypothetical protein [Actinoplanes sp. GCM10030250]|uniref:hypothetical protein n=1 Tax=Actinoplanes sp. GCM10030250 TaxID=3273376 RepID=UPI00360C3CD3